MRPSASTGVFCVFIFFGIVGDRAVHRQAHDVGLDSALEVLFGVSMAIQEDEVRVVARARKVTQAAMAGLATWSTSAKLDDEQLTIITPSRDMLPDILRYLVTEGADVYQFTPQRMSLEELFVSIMGEDRGL